jgi:hypothetical protein
MDKSLAEQFSIIKANITLHGAMRFITGIQEFVKVTKSLDQCETFEEFHNVYNTVIGMFYYIKNTVGNLLSRGEHCESALQKIKEDKKKLDFIENRIKMLEDIKTCTNIVSFVKSIDQCLSGDMSFSGDDVMRLFAFMKFLGNFRYVLIAGEQAYKSAGLNRISLKYHDEIVGSDFLYSVDFLR